MARIILTAYPGMVGYTMTVSDDVSALTAPMLAAAGVFDIVEIQGSKSSDVRLEGRSLLKAALTVINPIHNAMEGELAQRERCAKIADEFGAAAGNDSSGGVAHNIGQAIRALK